MIFGMTLFRFGGCTSRLTDYLRGTLTGVAPTLIFSHSATHTYSMPETRSRRATRATASSHSTNRTNTKLETRSRRATGATTSPQAMDLDPPTTDPPTTNPQLQLLRCQHPNPCHPGATACSPPPSIPLIQICRSRRNLRHALVPILVRRPSPRTERRATQRVLLEGKIQRHSCVVQP